MSRSLALTLAMENDIDSKRLISITLNHSKLAAEASIKHTSPTRRSEISTLINDLREERERIINSYINQAIIIRNEQRCRKMP